MRKLIVLCVLILPSPYRLEANPIVDATRKSCLFALSLVSEVEASFLALGSVARRLVTTPLYYMPFISDDMYIRLAGRTWDKERQKDFAITGRFLSELSALQLLNYDFKNKKIADIASGNSRLSQAVNLLYHSTGTHLTGVDFFANPLYLSYGTGLIRGDAFALPLESKSQDLTLSNWFIDYYLPLTFDPKNSGLEKDRIEILTREFIRITKDGGEIRIGTRRYQSEGCNWMLKVFQYDSRVETLRYRGSFPNGFIHVILKPE